MTDPNYQDWRKTSTKTRIETEDRIIRENRKENWRKTSTKTRIETQATTSIAMIAINWRKTSTKTRIETSHRPNVQPQNSITGERHPLKQGLKQRIPLALSGPCQNWRKTSTKTRIET